MKANIINNKMKGGKNKMRNISKISLLCIFTVILMQVSVIAFAADISYNNDQNNTTQEQIENIQSTDNIDTENELQPMMANNCPPSNWSYTFYDGGYWIKSATQTVTYSDGSTQTFTTYFNEGEFARWW